MEIKTPDILEKALKWIQTHGWAEFEPAFLADGGYSVADIFEYFDSKSTFLRYFMAFIDQHTLEEFSQNIAYSEDVLSEKELIWEMLMIRFEIMNCYKPAIQAIWHDTVSSANVKVLWDHFAADADQKMLQALQQACGAEKKILSGWLSNPVVFYGVRSYVFLTWVKEDTPDLPSTMAVIDQIIDKVASF